MGVIGGQLSGNISVIGTSTPMVDDLTLVAANTEYTYVFPQTTKSFMIRNMGNAFINYSYASGGTFRAMFLTEEIFRQNLSLSGPLTVYLKSVKANQLLEIEYWS